LENRLNKTGFKWHLWESYPDTNDSFTNVWFWTWFNLLFVSVWFRLRKKKLTGVFELR